MNQKVKKYIPFVDKISSAMELRKMWNFADCKRAMKKMRRNHLYPGFLAFGSARIPDNDPHIKEIEEISYLCAKRILERNKKISFITGGGPSTMTAWLKPAYQLGCQASAMAITLPFEEEITEFADKKLSFIFTHFSSRKKTMLTYAKAVIIFKGGFGTMDELYEALTLMQTGHMKKVPIFIYPADFYKDVLNFEIFLREKTIGQESANLITLVRTKEELLNYLYKIIDEG